MSAQEIIAELQKLTQRERRTIARQIFEMETDAQVMADCDARADANFLLLDQLEKEDAARKQR